MFLMIFIRGCLDYLMEDGYCFTMGTVHREKAVVLALLSVWTIPRGNGKPSAPPEMVITTIFSYLR